MIQSAVIVELSTSFEASLSVQVITKHSLVASKSAQG
jgi:hypothetical protein